MSEETSRLGGGAWLPHTPAPRLIWAGPDPDSWPPCCCLGLGGPQGCCSTAPISPSHSAVPPFGLRRGTINTALRQDLCL